MSTIAPTIDTTPVFSNVDPERTPLTTVATVEPECKTPSDQSDVQIEVVSSSVQERRISSLDRTRLEVEWDADAERTITQYMEACQNAAKECDRKYLHCKKMNTCFAVPSICIPIVLSTFQVQISSIPNLLNVLLLFSGIITGIQNVFGWAGKSQAFDDFSGKYSALSDTITLVLNKHKRHREAADIVIERTFQQLQTLNGTCPK